MTRVAVAQSNYIPWKGYFDLIASVDEFVFLDSVQFTKNDWRNRNRIKAASGLQWLTIPVGSNIRRKISEVELPDGNWREAHWRALELNYKKARNFDLLGPLVQSHYTLRHAKSLSSFNQSLIRSICDFLDIRTNISDSRQYEEADDPTHRLIGICEQLGATQYVTGPAARAYLREDKFHVHGIEVLWADYSGYPQYPQLWGRFVHEVSVLDLLFNCGHQAANYMKLRLA